MSINRGILFRTLISVVLALGGLAFFLAHRSSLPPDRTPSSATTGKAEPRLNWQEELPAIDQEVDSALAHFGIQKWWVKKKQYPVPDAQFSRIERRIEAPKDIMIVDMNTVLNAMAHRYNGRAIASENSRDHLVTIHIELDGFVVQTLIVHPTDNLPAPPAERRKQPKGGKHSAAA